MNIIKFSLITFFFHFYFQAFSQDFRSETPFNRPIITNSDSIKSVQLYKTGFQQTLPILNLNKSNETIELHFDYLSPNLKNFMYKVVHCDAKWNISDINFYDYADGLPEDYFINGITDLFQIAYPFSFMCRLSSVKISEIGFPDLSSITFHTFIKFTCSCVVAYWRIRSFKIV